MRQVAWPATFLIFAAAVVLAAFTVAGDFNWERTEIDPVTGESIGRCRGDHTAAFLVPVGIICVIPTVLTGVMAWKTSDVDDVYSESKWIFTLILVQLQVGICRLLSFVKLTTCVSHSRMFANHRLSLFVRQWLQSCRTCQRAGDTLEIH